MLLNFPQKLFLHLIKIRTQYFIELARCLRGQYPGIKVNHFLPDLPSPLKQTHETPISTFYYIFLINGLASGTFSAGKTAVSLQQHNYKTTGR